MPRKLKALENMAKPEHTFTHTIDGKAERGVSFFDVLNPSTAAPFAQCPDATKEQLDRAVASARLAFGPWSQLSFSDRRRFLHRFAARVEDYAQDLATVITREQGKPLSNAVREMAGTVHSLREMANLKVKDQVLRNDGKNVITLQYRPMVVVENWAARLGR